jgi:hypothetical protein
MLQVFYLDVAYILQWLHMCFLGCFICMLQVFHLFQTYVASILFGHCKSRSRVAHIAIGPTYRSLMLQPLGHRRGSPCGVCHIQTLIHRRDRWLGPMWAQAVPRAHGKRSERGRTCMRERSGTGNRAVPACASKSCVRVHELIFSISSYSLRQCLMIQLCILWQRPMLASWIKRPGASSSLLEKPKLFIIWNAPGIKFMTKR